MEVARVIILSGLPGSGKSSEAQVLKDANEALGRTVAIHSTDEFFIDSDGVYRFDPRMLGRYHEMNRNAFKRSLEQDVEVVIVDNTNLRREHREPYAILAEEHGYDVVYFEVGNFTRTAAISYAQRNVHGVKMGSILRMLERHQPVTDEECS